MNMKTEDKEALEDDLEDAVEYMHEIEVERWQREGFSEEMARRLALWSEECDAEKHHDRVTVVLILVMAELCADVKFDPPNRMRNIGWLLDAMEQQKPLLDSCATQAERKQLGWLMKKIEFTTRA